jgi:hypothetical protein
MQQSKESTVHYWGLKKQMADLKKEQEEFYNGRKKLALLQKWDIVKAKREVMYEEMIRIRRKF